MLLLKMKDLWIVTVGNDRMLIPTFLAYNKLWPNQTFTTNKYTFKLFLKYYHALYRLGLNFIAFLNDSKALSYASIEIFSCPARL